MNEKLEVVISADVSALSKELQAANKLLQQHERNYKGVQSAISQSTAKSNQLQGQLSNLNTEFKRGNISQAQYSKETDRVSAELTEANQSTRAYQKELKRLDREIDRVTAANKNFAGSANRGAAASNNLGNGVNKLGNATRVNAVPAMTSFSQVVQDAPYGIQGVANNIQQLTMQMGYLSKNAGGTGSALKAMGATLMGPTGILLAVSLVTSVLVTYGDELFAATDETKKLKEETEKAREEIDAFVDSLNNLEKVDLSTGITVDQELAALLQLDRQMSDMTRTAKEREDAYNELNKRYPETLANYKKEDLILGGLGDAYDKIAQKIKAGEGSSEAQKQINKNLEQRNQLQAKESDILDRLNTLSTRQADLRKKINDTGSQLYATELAKAEEKALELTKEREKVLLDINALNQQNISLSNKITFIPDEVNVDASKAKVNGGDGVRVPVTSVMAFEGNGFGKAIDATREFNQELKNQIELLKLVQSDLTVGSAAYLKFGDDITTLEDRLSGGMNGMQEKAREATETFAKMNKDVTEDVAVVATQQNALMMSLAAGFGSALNSIGDDLANGELTMESFAKTMRQTVIKVIAASLAQALAQAISGASSSAAATGPAAVATLPAFLATSMGAIFGAFGSIQGFADGGIVGGNSYHGDKILARLNSGELILNGEHQKKLNGMMEAPNMSGGSNSLEVTGMIQANGQVLQVILDRATSRNNRIS